jgi:formylglycine-generating enzyme required for sulfatase activity
MIALLLASVLAATVSAQTTAGMIRVPAGSVSLGRDDGPADERPAHRVVERAFDMDRTPVTNAEFARFLDAIGPTNARGENLFDVDDPDARVHRRAGRWLADPSFEDHPVVEVSWAGARDYCAWAGKRLPTEAEWEYAARGGDSRLYPWGAEPPDPTRARFGVGYNDTAPAGGFPAGASPFGVLGMSGNVWQWVSSAYRPYPYRADDGREALADPGIERVTRGGGHDSPREQLTTTHRGRHVSRAPRAGHHNIGFRCAR